VHIWLSNENRGFGGAERFTWQLGQALQKAGCTVTLVCRPNSWLASCDLPQLHLAFGSELDLLSRLQLLRHPRPHLVHCQAQRDLALFAGLTNWPIIKSEHSFLDSPGSAWLRRAYARCQRVVPVSHGLQEQMQQMLGNLSYQVIPNAMELPNLQQSVPERLQRGRWLGYVGGLLESKGILRMLEQLGPLVREQPDLGLLIAGDGPLKLELCNQVERLGLTSQVWMPGHIEDPLPYLGGLQVLIQPSPRETFSLVALEAMALQVPVVSCASGGLSEVVLHQQTGWLGDNLELGARLYLDQPHLREQHGRAARQRVEQFFTWQRVLPQWLDLYATVGSGPL
jgi:glycosyltransferase involved in cell wall biosynthesis